MAVYKWGGGGEEGIQLVIGKTEWGEKVDIDRVSCLKKAVWE